MLCEIYRKIKWTLLQDICDIELNITYNFLGTLIKIILACTNLRNKISCKNIPRDSWLFLPYVKLFHLVGTRCCWCCPLIVVNVNPQSFYCSNLLQMGTTSLSSLTKENGLRIQNDHTANQGNFGGLSRLIEFIQILDFKQLYVCVFMSLVSWKWASSLMNTLLA